MFNVHGGSLFADNSLELLNIQSPIVVDIIFAKHIFNLFLGKPFGHLGKLLSGR